MLSRPVVPSSSLGLAFRRRSSERATSGCPITFPHGESSSWSCWTQRCVLGTSAARSRQSSKGHWKQESTCSWRKPSGVFWARASSMKRLSRSSVARRSDPPSDTKLITEIPFAGVITTNYDKLLESAYAQGGQHPTRVHLRRLRRYCLRAVARSLLHSEGPRRYRQQVNHHLVRARLSRHGLSASRGTARR